MLTKLEEVIAEVFFAQPERGVDAITAANCALSQLIHSPYFGETYRDTRLVETGPDLWQLQFTHPNQGTTQCADPLRDWYEGWDGDAELTLPPLYRKEEEKHGSVSAHARELTQQFLAEAQKRLPAASAWLRAEPKALEKRQHLQVQVVDADDLCDLLPRILGPRYDASLSRYGIHYHSLPSYCAQHPWKYAVAHNDGEVAGIMAWNEREQEMGLSYISVAPGFRGQGLSKRLYQKMVDAALSRGKLIVRSSPGKFAEENPGITRGYDAFLEKSGALYVPSGTRFHQTVLDCGKDLAFPQWQEKCLVACQEFGRQWAKASYFERQDLDEAFSRQLHDSSPALPRRKASL